MCWECRHVPCSTFTGSLGIQTQVPVLAWQALHQKSHLSVSQSDFSGSKPSCLPPSIHGAFPSPLKNPFTECSPETWSTDKVKWTRLWHQQRSPSTWLLGRRICRPWWMMLLGKHYSHHLATRGCQPLSVCVMCGGSEMERNGIQENQFDLELSSVPYFSLLLKSSMYVSGPHFNHLPDVWASDSCLTMAVSLLPTLLTQP